jgi:hypothetical protein
MTFRLPDGSEFFRAHKPKMFGNKLNIKREMILDAIKSKKLVIACK